MKFKGNSSLPALSFAGLVLVLMAIANFIACNDSPTAPTAENWTVGANANFQVVGNTSPRSMIIEDRSVIIPASALAKIVAVIFDVSRAGGISVGTINIPGDRSPRQEEISGLKNGVYLIRHTAQGQDLEKKNPVVEATRVYDVSVGDESDLAASIDFLNSVSDFMDGKYRGPYGSDVPARQQLLWEFERSRMSDDMKESFGVSPIDYGETILRNRDRKRR